MKKQYIRPIILSLDEKSFFPAAAKVATAAARVATSAATSAAKGAAVGASVAAAKKAIGGHHFIRKNSVSIAIMDEAEGLA